MSDLTAWYLARIAALAAYATLSIALVTGMAMRTALFSGLARNRAVREVHTFLSWFWVPLVAAHVVALLLDGTARISPVDVVVPFVVGYARVPVGLGTLGLLLLLLVGTTSALRRHLNPRVWRWIHRASYPMLVLFLVHAQLAGSDFSRVWVSTLGWATMGGLMCLALLRVVGGRVTGGTYDRARDGEDSAAVA